MRAFFKFLAWVFGVLSVIILVLYLTMFEVWRVPANDPELSASLEPTLSAGDLLLVSRHAAPERGDLVRCLDPQLPPTTKPPKYVVARQAAKGGEMIDLNSEIVSVDNSRIPSPHACDPPDRTMVNPLTGDEVQLSCSTEDLGGKKYDALRAKDHPESARPVPVESGKAYLVSDNRHLHKDSRDYGQVDPATCKQIVFRLWGKGGFGDAKKRFSFLW